MKQRLMRRLSRDDVLRYGSIMFVASIATHILNYLYQVAMGRMLGPEEYGIFGALFAIFYMSSVVSQTLATSTTSFISRLKARGESMGAFISGALRRSGMLGVLISAAVLAGSGTLAEMLRVPEEDVRMLALILLLTFLLPVPWGVLRGMKRFLAVGALNIISAGAKLAIGVVLVWLGYGVTGALASTALGLLLALAAGMVLISPHMTGSSQKFSFTSFYSYSLPVLIAMLCFSVPANLDVVLAKYFFSAREAGLYTSASVLGKISFFFPSVYAVMFPMIAEAHARGERTTEVLLRCLKYALALSGGVVLIYWTFPGVVVAVFGSSYAPALPLLLPYSITMLFFSVSAILLNYHLAIRNMRYVLIFSAFTLLEVVLLLLFNATPLQMVQVMLAVNLALSVCSLIYTLRGRYGQEGA
ncbi:MAG: oligosaccharide flippase family protein [Euryarchaeota archaeon]|nr:oligosaccharide flippase family protein [Euryarchaeota archaeon]